MLCGNMQITSPSLFLPTVCTGHSCWGTTAISTGSPGHKLVEVVTEQLLSEKWQISIYGVAKSLVWISKNKIEQNVSEIAWNLCNLEYFHNMQFGLFPQMNSGYKHQEILITCIKTVFCPDQMKISGNITPVKSFSIMWNGSVYLINDNSLRHSLDKVSQPSILEVHRTHLSA